MKKDLGNLKISTLFGLEVSIELDSVDFEDFKVSLFPGCGISMGFASSCFFGLTQVKGSIFESSKFSKSSALK